MEIGHPLFIIQDSKLKFRFNAFHHKPTFADVRGTGAGAVDAAGANNNGLQLKRSQLDKMPYKCYCSREEDIENCTCTGKHVLEKTTAAKRTSASAATAASPATAAATAATP